MKVAEKITGYFLITIITLLFFAPKSYCQAANRSLGNHTQPNINRTDSAIEVRDHAIQDNAPTTTAGAPLKYPTAGAATDSTAKLIARPMISRSHPVRFAPADTSSQKEKAILLTPQPAKN